MTERRNNCRNDSAALSHKRFPGEGAGREHMRETRRLTLSPLGAQVEKHFLASRILSSDYIIRPFVSDFRSYTSTSCAALLAEFYYEWNYYIHREFYYMWNYFIIGIILFFVFSLVYLPSYTIVVELSYTLWNYFILRILAEIIDEL